jgi:hemolysin activation/secretion protein
VTGDVGLDNTGARATGRHRTTANLYLNSPGLRGELISLNALHSAGSDYARVSMTVPVQHSGWRLGLNGSTMSYKVIDGPSSTSTTPIQGRSGAMGLELRYAVLRSVERNLFLSGQLDNKTFYTQDTLVRSDYASNTLRLEASANQMDSWGAGGASNASLQLLWGQLTDMKAHNLIDTIERQYRKLNFNLSRHQYLTDQHTVLLSVNGQYATQRLDSSEKFYIGGAQSVRAYPASELGGDRGELISAEWRWTLDPAWTLGAFVDQGRVSSLANATAEATRWTLRGHGLSLDWQGPRGWLARATWARRNGVNPQPTSTGSDSDGSLQYNRLWFTTSVNF